MLEHFIKYAFTIVPVVIALALLKKELSKKVERNADGSFELCLFYGECCNQSVYIFK